MEQTFETTEEEYILLGYYLGRQKLLNCVALQHLVNAFLNVLTKPAPQDPRTVVPPEKGCCLCCEKATIFKEFLTRYRKRANVHENFTEKDADDAWNDIVQLWKDVEAKRQSGELQSNSIVVTFEQACQGILEKHKVKIYSDIKANLNERSNLLKWVALIEKVKGNLEYCHSSLFKLCALDYEATRKSEPYEVESDLMTTSMTLILKNDVMVNLEKIQNCRNTGVVVRLLQKPQAVDIKCSICTNCLRWNSLDDFSSMMTVLSKFQGDLGTKKSILNTHKKMVTNSLKQSQQKPQMPRVDKVNSPISVASSPKDPKRKEYYEIISQKLKKENSAVHSAACAHASKTINIHSEKTVCALASKTINIHTEKTDVARITRILIPRRKPIPNKTSVVDRVEKSKTMRTSDGVSETTTFKLIKLTPDGKPNSQAKMFTQGTQNPIRISQATQSAFDSTIGSDCLTFNKNCDKTPIQTMSNTFQGNCLDIVEKASSKKDSEVVQGSSLVPTCPAELFHFADSHFSTENKSLIICSTDRRKKENNATNGLCMGRGLLTTSEDVNLSLKKACLGGNIHGPFSFVQSLTDIEEVLTQKKNPSFYYVPESLLNTKSSGTFKNAQKIGPIFLCEEDTKLLKSLLFYKDSTSNDEFVALYQLFEKRIVESISRFASDLPAVEKDPCKLEEENARKDDVEEVDGEYSEKSDKKREKYVSEDLQDTTAAILDEKKPKCVKSIATVTAEHITNFIQTLEKKCQELSELEETSDIKYQSSFLLNNGKVETDEVKTYCFKKCSCSKLPETKSNINVCTTKLNLEEIKTWIPKCLSERTKALLQNVLDCESKLLKMFEEYASTQKAMHDENIKEDEADSIKSMQNFSSPASNAIDDEESRQTSPELVCATASVVSPVSSMDEALDHCQQDEFAPDFSTNFTGTACVIPLHCALKAKYRKNDQGVWSLVKQNTVTSEISAPDKTSVKSQYHESKKQFQILKRRKALVKLALVDALEPPTKFACTTENASRNFIFNSFRYQSYLDPHSTVVYSNPSHYTSYPDVHDVIFTKNKSGKGDLLQKPVEEDSNELDKYSFSFSRKDSSIQSHGKNMFLEDLQSIRDKVLSNKKSNSKKTATLKRKQQASNESSGESTRKHRCLSSYPVTATKNTEVEFIQTLSSKDIYFALSALCLTAPQNATHSISNDISEPTLIVESVATEPNDLQQGKNSESYHLKREPTDFTTPNLDAISVNSIFKRKCKVETNLHDTFRNSDSMHDLLPELRSLDDIIVKIENVEDSRTQFWFPDTNRHNLNTQTENDELPTDSENDVADDTERNGQVRDSRLNTCRSSHRTFTDIFMFLKAGMKKTLPKARLSDVHDRYINIAKQFKRQKCYVSDRLTNLLSSGYRLDQKTMNWLQMKKKQHRKQTRRLKISRYQGRDQKNRSNFIGQKKKLSGGFGKRSVPPEHRKSSQNVQTSMKQDIAKTSAGNTTALGKPKKRKNELEYLLEGVHNANKHAERNKSRRSSSRMGFVVNENHAKQFPEEQVLVENFNHKYSSLKNAYIPLVRCSEGVVSKRKLGQ